jgi:hypothetical protein
MWGMDWCWYLLKCGLGMGEVKGGFMKVMFFDGITGNFLEIY